MFVDFTMILVWDGRLIIDGRGSGAALVRYGRCRGRYGRGCDGQG